MAVGQHQSPCETRVFPTVLLLLLVALLLIHTNQYRCNNVNRPIPIHNQYRSNKEAAHPQVFLLQEISHMVKVRLLQDMATAHIPKVARQ